jgi:hypothetical protein
MEIIKSINEFLTNNPWLNAIFLILAILGISISVILYIKSKRVRIPVYSIRSINLIKSKLRKIKSVEILYQGDKVDNLTISKLALWNAGKETINSQDVAKIEPLKISLKNNSIILDAEVLYQKNPANNFKICIDKNNNEISIDFDYFDFYEGAIIQIYHTGISSLDIEMNGKIKSTSKIIRKKNPDFPNILFLLPDQVRKKLFKDIPMRKLRIIFGFSFLLIPMIFIPLLFITSELQPEENILWLQLLISLILLFAYGGLGINIMKRKIPKGFDIFEEEF